MTLDFVLHRKKLQNYMLEKFVYIHVLLRNKPVTLSLQLCWSFPHLYLEV